MVTHGRQISVEASRGTFLRINRKTLSMRHLVSPHRRRIDTAALLASVDLSALLAAELGPPTAGAWRCPFHEDGTPSMGLVKGNRELWHCLGCGLSGDALEFIMRRRGLSFRDACTFLAAGRTLPELESGGRTARAPRAAAIRQATPPPAAWAERAGAVAAAAAARLWTPAGRPGLEYLRSRGLSDDTARAFGLGWLPEDSSEPPAAWGLPEDHKPVWTPAGIAIPWHVDGECWRLNVRRIDGAEPKYIGPAGFRAALYNADSLAPGRPAVLLEGEFDALATYEAAGWTVAAVATGSTSGGRAARWLYRLAACPVVAVCFDSDTAGDEAAGWWLERLPNARRLRPPEDAKDAAGMPRERLRAWLADKLGLALRAPLGPFPAAWLDAFSDERLERLAIRTADGALSDSEALRAENLEPPEDPAAAAGRSESCKVLSDAFRGPNPTNEGGGP